MVKKRAIIYLCLLLLLVQAFTTGNAGTGTAQAEPTGAANPKILKMVPAKARFVPGEAAELMLTLDQSADWSGRLHLQIYQLNTLVAEGAKALTVLKDGSNQLTVSWTPPGEDFRGYTAKAWIEGAAPTEYVTAAIDVSSDWTQFPRYGYVADFPQETAEESDSKLKELSQDYYINAYQFYDWMWRHDVSVFSRTDENGQPLTDADGNFMDEDMNAYTRYADLLGRSLYPLTVKQQIEAAQKYGSAAMAYQMNYAARENYEDFGVSPEWGLYNSDQLDQSNPQKDQNGYSFEVNGKTTSLFLQDPGNKFWQDYITRQFERSINTFGFNGIHLDQWGANDSSFLYDYNGNKRYYSLDYAQLINSVKDSLLANNPEKSDVTFNMVGGNAEYSAVPDPETKTDFDYSEIWQDRNLYRDLQQVVEDTREKDGGKAMVIAGYMNYKEATGLPTRGTEALDVPVTLDYQSRIAKAYGWVGNFGRKDTDSVTFTVNAPADGIYTLTLEYGQGNASGFPEGKLTVNGETAAAAVPFEANTGWGNPTAQAVVTARLAQGENSVKLTLNTNSLWLNLAALKVQGQGMNERFEAVDAGLDTVIVDQYSHVYYFETAGDYVKFHVNVPAEGDYPLSLSYASDWQAVNRQLLVNDVPQGEVSFAGLGTWDKFVEHTNLANVHLNAGDNTITLKASTDDLGIKLKDITVGGQKYYALDAEVPQTGSESIDMGESPFSLYKDTVLNFGEVGQQVTYPVNIPQSGEQSLIFTYSNPGSLTTRSVYIDGVRAKDELGKELKIGLDSTESSEKYSGDGYVIIPHMEPGLHTVTLRMEADDIAGTIRLRGVTAGYFNEPSVRLMDAGLASMGATHIELGTAGRQWEGPNMLAHEYYPNRSKKMLESTKESMQEYYKFNAAYENLLFGSKADSSAVLSVEADGSNVATSKDGTENTLWTTVRKNEANPGFERYEVLHLINLLNNDDNWRNAANEPAVLQNLRVSYDIGLTAQEAADLKVYAATPDAGHGLSQELKYTWNGEQLQIELPSLQYWTMIYIDKAPETAAVQPIFSNGVVKLP